MKLQIKEFSYSFSFCYLRSKYSPRHPVPSEYVPDQLLRCPVSHVFRFLISCIINVALPSSTVAHTLCVSVKLWERKVTFLFY
jgi:hypothetical protein